MIGILCLLASSIAALSIWLKLRSVFSNSRLPVSSIITTDEEKLPTVSLCIPARNEVHAMVDCLESALRSNYPKLEIIVLDDGSRDDTVNLIKSFAHAGVRFIEGTAPPEGWLGKNNALNTLAEQASGSLLLFADVDTRFSTQSIERLVTYATEQSADMVSVLPIRHNPARLSSVLATFRHFWNLLAYSKEHPSVASNAWIIKRSLLIDELGGFKNTAQDVRPEKVIAQQIVQLGKTYKFIISNANLGVSYEKKLSSQYETAVRIYYPDFGLKGILIRVAGLGVGLLPYLVLVAGILSQDIVLIVGAAAAIIVWSGVNAWYLAQLRSFKWSSYGLVSIVLPYSMLREIHLLMASFIQYKRNRIVWKGRPVAVSKR